MVLEKERDTNKILSMQSRRDKNNRSKVGQKRVLHNSRNTVVFNEFKTEDKVNQEVGLNEDKVNKSKSEIFDADIESVEYDQSHLDEAISYQYSLADRSYSYEQNENSIEGEKDNIKEENFVEIVEQDSFEKLKEYKDRLPCLSIRKLFLRIRLIITKLAYVIISHWMFEYASLLVIITNSVVLALEDPTDPDASNSRPMQILDQVFLALYTLEMALKILGLGFILNKGSYLRDNWNILDFIIVVSAYLQLLLSSGANLSVLRSFRVLRPLKTISGIEGLKIIVTALMKAVTLLVDTVIILVFFFIIFAIAGTQLWSGVLKKRCVNENTGTILSEDYICGSVTCPDGYF